MTGIFTLRNCRKNISLISYVIYLSIQSGPCVSIDNGERDSLGYSCDVYIGREKRCGKYDTNDFDAHSMCCACREDKVKDKGGKDNIKLS